MTNTSNEKNFPHPRIIQAGIFLLLIVSCIVTATSAATSSGTSTTTDTALLPPAYTQVTVTNVTVDPGVFFTGDLGTITVEVGNTGTQSVNVHRATVYDQDIRLVSTDTYDTGGAIGAGNRQKFTFTVLADVPEGIYYPVFSIEFQDTGYLRYPIAVQVKNSLVILSIQDKPDTFAAGKKSSVTLAVSNTRTNTIRNIIVSHSMSGVDIIPTSTVIGSLDPGMSETLKFSITPQTESTLEFDATYLNGINTHHANISIPVRFETDKTQADPVVNNIEVVSQGSSTKVTGDITNSGLEDAKSVTVTVDAPAEPVDPYKEYAIGLLKSDDFSSFQLTFNAAGAAKVPLIVHWKDADGNLYTDTTQLDLRASDTVNGNSSAQVNSQSSRAGGMGGGLFGGARQGSTFAFPWLWIIAGAGIAIAAVGIWWKKFRKGRKH